ncbi:origin recognition complex subunit 4 [Trichonephila inaurata madagascariensis]|uniref:Origin recognition complex subunit 4 n=1 Tax=Trichonephila inaurata madagascariensis TaxID=2747483 RepID=A0A8X6YWH2_9ARAC|nr:origin recognition complex subunit 4 [Trichonephila inaurata madagascariensis]
MSREVWTELIISLRDQLKPYGYCNHLLNYLEPKKQHLENIIKRTALMSESSSVLVIGAVGSGKSTLLESALETVFQNHLVKDNMLHVALDGLIHTTDDLALEDITKQLKSKEVESKSENFSEKLRLLLAALKSGTKESKSVLFVLDNFELFCTHKNQNLLYNLFDIAQLQQTPICIIGMCSRPDLLQVLENRVNSRFSHQKILLFDEMTLDEYINCAKEFLILHDFKDFKFQKRWNADIKNLFKETGVKNVLENCFNCSQSLRDLKQLLQLVVMNIEESHPKLTVKDFEDAYEHSHTADSKGAVMRGLSVLELTLVIAMMHLTEIYDNEPFNFEIVFNELTRFLHNRMKWNVEKPVVMKAFEHLLDLELIKSSGDSSSNVLKRYMLVRLLVTPDEVREAVESSQNLPVVLKQWTESSIDG